MGGYDPRAPKQAYGNHRRNAIERGVNFEMTFEEWWRVWEASGCFENRGRGRGKHVMARVNLNGPYKVGNVKIVKVGRWAFQSIANSEK